MSAGEFAPHDDLGRLDRSICGLCNDAYVECSGCGIYLCDCTRSETCEGAPTPREQAIEAAEDRAEQASFEVARERGL